MSAGKAQAFLFADMAGFTQLTEAHGDHEAADLVEQYAESLSPLAHEYGAELVKTIGDAVLMRVPDAREAVSLGVRIVDDVGAQHGFPAVSIGIDYGPAVERSGDFFGRSVNIAARVTALAGSGQVLLTEAVSEAAGEVEGLEISHFGCHGLKGLSDDVDIFSAASVDSKAEEGLPVDPVCKMAVDPARCAGKVHYRGTDYHFCSDKCKEQFSSNPEGFVPSPTDC